MRFFAFVMLGLVAFSAECEILIDPESRQVGKGSAGVSILTSGSGSWEASTDVDWITITPRVVGAAGVSCVYLVAPNKTADVRIGHIFIGGKIHTVSQSGYDAAISPLSAKYTLEGGDGQIDVTVQDGISWTAKANADWIVLKCSSGVGGGSVVYTVNSYESVVARSSTITVAGREFVVKQTGIDVKISPKEDSVGAGVEWKNVLVTAMGDTSWRVTSDSAWISVVSDVQNTGDGVVVLVTAANPSALPRRGTVKIGSASYTLYQEGLDKFAFDITPKDASASATGAHGNIAVMATPDLPWTATSLTSWLSFPGVVRGAGNGNVGYAVSANPTLTPREAKVLVEAKKPEKDINLATGLDMHNGKPVMANGQYPSYSKWVYDENLQGRTTGGRFRVDTENEIHRLYDTEDASLFVNESGNLCLQSSTMMTNTGYHVVAGTDYVAFLISDGTNTSVHVSPSNVVSFAKVAQVSSAQTIQKAGMTRYPSSGSIDHGIATYDFRWYRAITERELAHYQSYSITSELDDFSVYSDLVEYSSCRSIRTKMGSVLKCILPTYGTETPWNRPLFHSDRHGHAYGAMSAEGGFDTGYFNKYVYTGAAGNAYGSSYTAIESYSINVWVKILSTNCVCDVFNAGVRCASSLTATTSTHVGEGICISNGVLIVYDALKANIRSVKETVHEDAWYMFTITGERSDAASYPYRSRTRTFYINGMEVENKQIHIASDSDRSYLDYPCWRLGGPVANGPGSPYAKITGGQNLIWDEYQVYKRCLSAKEVFDLYNHERPMSEIHKVTQGVISPMASPKSKAFDAAEGQGSFEVTVPQVVNWAVENTNSWVHPTGTTSYKGSQMISYTIDENTSVYERTAILTLAGVDVCIVQRGLGSSVSYNDSELGVDGGFGLIDVQTEGNAFWRADSSAEWITIVMGESGVGAGTVMFVADPYTDKTRSRTGIVVVAGKNVYVTQCGYQLSITPEVEEIGGNPSSGSIVISAPIDAMWEAMADVPWITIEGYSANVGNGVVNYTVSENDTGAVRTGRIIVSGREYSITQTTKRELIVDVVGQGSVSGGGKYNQNQKVVLEARAADGYVFSHWSGDMVGVSNVVTVVMDGGKRVSATFIPESAAQQIVKDRGVKMEGLYTKDQMHGLGLGNLVIDVDETKGRARLGLQVVETDDLVNPNWRSVGGLSVKDLNVGDDDTVGIMVPATGKAKFFKVVVPDRIE